MTAEDLAALSQAVRHNVGWHEVPAADDNALGAMRDRVGRGLFLELGRLPANSPNITFKITEQGRAAVACASLAA